MGTGTLTPEAPPVDGDVEPIDVVFARLAVDVDALSVEGCDQWAVDALRLDGWLKVRGLRVEQVRRERVFASWAEPGDEETDETDETDEADPHDPVDGEPADADPADPAGSGQPNADTGADAASSGGADGAAGSGEPSPSPVDVPGRQSRR